ncbi:MAG: asparagine synthase (glutamine-hydrolyzing) [bacterium]|nr:asparagine synthase (glutamine-hydrolyzing) [bacterium]
MCGIFGFIQEQPSAFSPDEILTKATESIHHRGPDDVALAAHPPCFLGMRRLSIIDLSPNLYPFYNADRSLALIFNGEIYNFPALRKELESHGHQFRTHCDAEVILAGYEEWGEEVIAKLRGMFAIALWNNKDKSLTLIRDRLGIKPLYYLDLPAGFFFASEVKAFTVLPKDIFPRQLDPLALDFLTGLMFIPNNELTALKGVKKLPPGHILRRQNGKTDLRKYWDLSQVEPCENLSFEAATQKLDEKLVEVTRMHLLADVPLGILLSGGIDSATIAALVTKHKLQNEINTYTASFNHAFNEGEKARVSAQAVGSIHHEIPINVKEISDKIEDYIWYFDDLTTLDGGLLTTLVLCEKIAQRGIKVLLLGEGADEIFGGYSWFGLSQLPFKYLGGGTRNFLYYYALSRNLTYHPLHYFQAWQHLMPKEKAIFRQITLMEVGTQLPNHLLMKVDKGSMARSIEARVPYLDHELVEFVYSLPQEFKLQGQWFNTKKPQEKFILRQVAQRYLPPVVTSRKKRGFMLPILDFLKFGEEKVKNYLLDPQSVSRQLLGTGVESLFASTTNPILAKEREFMLWRLFLIEVWAKKYLTT